ncbi:MAG TPA: YraN family protein [Acidobacteriota bacterium]|nr:YraN family protein [Acidobacteriota bacterium]
MVIESRGQIGRFDRLVVRIFKPTLGQWGEWVALRYLRQQKWDIVARNWKGKRGELDLVAYDGEYLVFIEVKTRQLPSLLTPEDQITKSKETMLDLLTSEFTMRYEVFDRPSRLDVIAIETTDMASYQLRHYISWDSD